MKWIILLLFPLLCFSQDDSYNQILKLPKKKFDSEVIKRIDSLESLDLWNFLQFLEEDNNIPLKQYNKTLLAKAEKSLWPNELFFLTEILIKQDTEKKTLEKILVTKKDIWDYGQWSQKFWSLILANSFSIPKDKFYTINPQGEKTYNPELYIAEKLKNNQMGNNPLLFVDEKIMAYSSDQLISTLKKLNIKDIQLTPKDKSINLYGKKGIDGMLQVSTKK